MHYQQKGYGILVEKYVKHGSFSEEYKNLMVFKRFLKELFKSFIRKMWGFKRNSIWNWGSL